MSVKLNDNLSYNFLNNENDSDLRFIYTRGSLNWNVNLSEKEKIYLNRKALKNTKFMFVADSELKNRNHSDLLIEKMHEFNIEVGQ